MYLKTAGKQTITISGNLDNYTSMVSRPKSFYILKVERENHLLVVSDMTDITPSSSQKPQKPPLYPSLPKLRWYGNKLKWQQVWNSTLAGT